MSEEIILETVELTKEFAGFVAVSGVNLRIARGTIHALIGPNGAGKTTCFVCSPGFSSPPAAGSSMTAPTSPGWMRPMWRGGAWCDRFRYRRCFPI
jgi:ABC-type branched-subunit amino acid transport system ATPase component